MAPPAGLDPWSTSAQSQGSSADKLFASDFGVDREEPLSLRRLRESLSCLERLERQRGELRGCTFPPSCSPTVLCGTAGLGLDSDRAKAAEGLPIRGLHFEHSEPSPLLGSSGSPRASTPQRTMPASVPVRTASRERDNSALALALERSQDRIDVLTRERDEALRKAASQEAEVVKLSLQLEKFEAEHRNLTEERQRDLSELSRIRREHRETLEQLSALRAEAHQSRATSEEWRQRFDKLVADQRQQIAALEDAGGRASRDLVEHETRAIEFGDGLYTCIHERTALLHFVVDLLAALQSLFYDPTPFVLVTPPVRPSRTCSSGARARSSSYDRIHRHNSFVPSCATRPSSAYGARHTEGRQDWRDGLTELQELIASLENEIAESSERYTAQVHRIVDEAEQCARTLRAAETDAGLGDRSSDRGVLRTCSAWCEQERRRLELLGLPTDCLAPRVDWAEERAQYHAITRQMEAKFTQLMKLKRVLQARQQVLKKRGC